MHFSEQELRGLGVTFGRGVNVHRSVVLINPDKIVLGDHVRIDCFSLVSAGTNGVSIGRNVHLAAGVYVYGSGGPVVLEDFANISARVSIYTVSDDYKTGSMTNPTVPLKYKRLTSGPVTIRRHAIVGNGTVIMPGVELGEGAAVGALSFVRRSVPAFKIVAGNPLRVLGERGRELLELERQYLAAESAAPRSG